MKKCFCKFATLVGLIASWAALVMGASGPGLRAATFSDDNWTGMGGYAGANGHVNATVVDGSGDLYIGGRFTVVGDLPANCIAKWNGTHWSALGSGLQGSNGWAVVYALAVSGSDLYAAGRFTTAGGVAANNIAKWNGTNWSALGSGIGGSNDSVAYVYALAASGNDVYAAGDFTTAGGVAANRIAQWNGSSWSALGSDPPNGIPQVFAALAVSGSDLYAGMESGVAKWDGSSWSALGSGMNKRVTALAVSGHDVYASGSSTNVAKWDGSSWSVLASSVGSGIGYPQTLTVSGGDLYAGGNLLTYLTSNSYSYRAYVAKWTGSSWLELGTGMDGSSVDVGDPEVKALAVSGSNVYAGGDFQQAGEVRAYHIAKWNGSNWSALAPPFRFLTALAASGRDVYGAGTFAANGTESNYVAKWNGNGWSRLGSETFTGVSALAAKGNELYAAGNLTDAYGAPNRIAKWEGNDWSMLASEINGHVHALAISGNDLYIAGYFTTVGGVAANNIAKWNGNSWSPLGMGLGATGGVADVTHLAVSGSNLYAAGRFTTAGGIPATNIARWNGSSWSALGSGLGFYVSSLAVSGTDVYVGGVNRYQIYKWDGSRWSALGDFERRAGDGPDMWAMVTRGTDLYVGGWFFSSLGSGLNIAKWDGSNWSALGSGINGRVHQLVATDTELFALGGFATAGGKLSVNLAHARIGVAAQGVSAANSAASIRFSGVTGYPHDVQRVTSLTPPVVWTTVSSTSLYPAADGSFTFTDTNAAQGAAFYRAAAIGLGAAACPRLGLQQPAGTRLTNGVSTVGFGSVALGSSGTKIFTITNSGAGALIIHNVSTWYWDSEFVVNTSGMLTNVPAGGSTTFTVSFSPTSSGSHSEELDVWTDTTVCYDPTEGLFTLNLTGAGL